MLTKILPYAKKPIVIERNFIFVNNTSQTPIPLDSRITDVTVFLSGAQVYRKCPVPKTEGAQKFVFNKLPASLLAQSIQVSAGNGVAIHSVEHSIDYLQKADYTAEIVELHAKLDALETERKNELTQIELGELEEKLFAENMRLAGTESGLKAQELKAAVLFYNERMAAIREASNACGQKIKELDLEISAVQAQLGRYREVRSEPVSKVVVNIVAEGDTSASDISLSYFVNSASWVPSYDIRAKDIGSDIAFHYKAKVSQQTGENWDNARLCLSTGNPSISGSCPKLEPWRLDFPRVFKEMPARSMRSRMMDAAPAAAPLDMETEALAPFAAAPEPAVTATQSITSVEYNITAPLSIASGDEGQDVEITVHSLPAKFSYRCIRKLDPEVYLLASLSGWEHLNLVEGNASVYFENRYIGQTNVDPNRAGEDFDLSLGVDKAVIVTRTRGRNMTAKTITGANVKQTRQWTLVAKNLKTAPIDIELIDQVPVSVNKQITVDVAEISGAEIDKDTGILSWKFALEPTESKAVTVKYVVSNPKNTTVYLD
ncbi:MAG: DUF4139 domain-containing protein [Eubacteriaceae bacterium]|nr:DUF4139 domain-containing protein [Eubacteriaceae bacterium]